jgi:hypothetical protein
VPRIAEVEAEHATVVEAVRNLGRRGAVSADQCSGMAWDVAVVAGVVGYLSVPSMKPSNELSPVSMSRAARWTSAITASWTCVGVRVPSRLVAVDSVS